MTTTAPRIRLESIHIENFRGIDQLDLAFPEPVMADEPDVLVLGSANGGGKTSVLEACALAVSGLLLGDKLREHLMALTETDSALNDYLIHGRAHMASARAVFATEVPDRKKVATKFELHRSNWWELHSDEPRVLRDAWSKRVGGRWSASAQDKWLGSLLGYEPDPLLLPPLIFFHGYRKVAEGNPTIAKLADTNSGARKARRRTAKATFRNDDDAGLFKLEALRCLMGRSGLFETGAEDAERVLSVLNRLMAMYAGGTIEKLRPADDGSIDLRVTPVDKNRSSFTFDALSSGQKEIISTLFLIWLHTDKQPGIVLLDEPELHLNAEWHTRFLRSLHELCPQNQYIIATHSRTIFESVPPQKRVLLEPSLPGSVEPSV